MSLCKLCCRYRNVFDKISQLRFTFFRFVYRKQTREGQKRFQFFFYFITINKHSSTLITKVSYTGVSAQREAYLVQSTTVKSPCSILNVFKGNFKKITLKRLCFFFNWKVSECHSIAQLKLNRSIFSHTVKGCLNILSNFRLLFSFYLYHAK